MLETLLELISTGDFEAQIILLENLVIDLSLLYDARGYSMLHLVCMNNDHKSLEVLLTYALSFWLEEKRYSEKQAYSALAKWVNKSCKREYSEKACSDESKSLEI